jgi:hypothetical protein
VITRRRSTAGHHGLSVESCGALKRSNSNPALSVQLALLQKRVAI